MPSDVDDDVGVDDEEVKKPSGSGSASAARGGGGGGGRGGKVAAVAGPGLAPVYVSDAGLDKYSMKKGTRVTDIVDFKVLPKAEVIKEIMELKDQCDFFALKEQMEVRRATEQNSNRAAAERNSIGGKSRMPTHSLCPLFASRQEYEGDQFLFIRGPENEFEYNYLWCSTTDSYDDHLQEMKERSASGAKGEKEKDLMGGGFEEEDGGGGGDDDEDGGGGGRGKRGKRSQFDSKGDGGEEKATIKRPVEAMTDIQIATLTVKSHRAPLGFFISQSRFKFAKPFEFDDVEPAEKLAEYRHSKIPGYNESRMVLERGFQAAPRRSEMATQTSWANSVNKATQYTPALLRPEEQDALLSSQAMADFLSHVESLTIRELQMNETLDIFKDEFEQFADEEVSLGNRLENSLEIFHSFSHFKFSKGKNIIAAQWMPTITPAASSGGGAPKGLGGSSGQLVAFACSNTATFDQWVEQSGKVLTSSILLYSLTDILHPYLVLEVPGNITCFKVHPSAPQFICAGLTTGQVIFWDLSDAREKVRSYQEQQQVNLTAYNRSGQNKTTNSGAGGAASGAGSGSAAAPASSSADGSSGDGGVTDEIAIPPIKYTVLSYIDRSHSRPVTDLVWLPAAQQVNRRGEMYTAEKSVSSQFASVGADGKLLIWDFKNKNDGAAAKVSAAAAAAAMGQGAAANSLAARVAAAAEDPDAKEPRWAPIFSLPLSRSDNSGIVTVQKLALGEGTCMMAVTEDGEMVEIDWGARGTEERSKPDTIRSIQRAHFASAASVERSPHFSDIYLTVGDWTFSIWKVGVEFPVFTSSCSADYLAAGRWSPTRPGIIVTARADGTLDIWDLIDQCHKSSLNFATGFNEGLSSLEFWQNPHSSSQYLATGDIGGKLHIIEVPRNLRRKIANEENLMRLFYEREIARSKYARRRLELRKAKAQRDAQAKNKMASSVAVAVAAAGAAAAGMAAASADDASTAAAAGSVPGAPSSAAASSGLSASALAAQQARDEKAAELAAREKAERLRQLEEEKAEKEYQRLFDAFKSSLQPEDMRKEEAPLPAAAQMRK